MTAKSMAEVLAEHQFLHHSFNGVTQKRYLACSCGALPLAGDHPTHLAEALSAAGFGLVADTKAEAGSAMQEAMRIAWEEGRNAVWAFMSNTDPRRERPTNPYRAAL